MTDNEIIDLAEKAGVHQFIWFEHGSALIAFANLVAMKKKEKMIREGWRQCAEGQTTTQYCPLAEAAIRAKGEA